MQISQAMLEWFYYTLQQTGTSYYRGYTLKVIARNKEVRLLKDNRKLASWFLFNNEVKTYGTEKTPAEKGMVKKFHQMPLAVELFHRDILSRFAEKKEAEARKKQEIQEQFMLELNEMCSSLKEEEITKQRIEGMVEKIAYRYLDQWYVVGIHPDRYDDNFPMYDDIAKSRVRGALSDVDDERILKFLGYPKDRVPFKSYEQMLAELSDDELIEKVHIRPIRAQREGNLVTISELENKRFCKLAMGAIEFAKKTLTQNIRNFLHTNKLVVYWWEKDGQYFLPAVDERKQPETFRDLILGRLEPKVKETAKPSRIEMEIDFQAKEKEMTSYQNQKGIICWR